MKIASISWNSSVGGLFFVFVFSLFLFYSLMPVIMKISNAVVINLSLLTADIYTLVFGIFLFNYKVCIYLILLYNIHTYLYTYMYIHMLHTYIYTYMHTYKNAYIHHIHTYIMYIHTYICTYIFL